MSAAISNPPSDLNGSDTSTYISNNSTLGTRDSARAAAKFDPGAMYVLLFDIGEPTSFHWGLFAALNEKGGLLYHKSNNGGSLNTPWPLKVDECANVLVSKRPMAALKFSRLKRTDSTFMRFIKERLETVRARSRTSRDWLLEAVNLLANEELISLQPYRTVVMSMCAEGDKLAETCYRERSFRMETSVRYQ